VSWHKGSKLTWCYSIAALCYQLSVPAKPKYFSTCGKPLRSDKWPGQGVVRNPRTKINHVVRNGFMAIIKEKKKNRTSLFQSHRRVITARISVCIVVPLIIPAQMPYTNCRLSKYRTHKTHVVQYLYTCTDAYRDAIVETPS